MNENDQQPTSAEEFARIAKLTSNAVKTSGDKLIADVQKAIESAEQSTSMLRLEADNLVEEIRKHTGAFADKVSTFVSNCHSATVMFREYKDKLEDMPNGVQNFHTLESEAEVNRAIGNGERPLHSLLARAEQAKKD